MQPQTHKNTPIKALNGLKHVKKCRNDVLKYGYDSRKIDSVMACFVRGGRKSAPPCSFHTVLQAADYRVKTAL